MPKHKRKQAKNTNSDKGKPYNHQYKSEAKSNRNRLFHQTKTIANGATQTTTFTVNIDQKEDCLTGCFSALARCFKR